MALVQILYIYDYLKESLELKSPLKLEKNFYLNKIGFPKNVVK